MDTPILNDKSDYYFLLLIIRIFKENNILPGGDHERIVELYKRVSKMNTQYDPHALRILLDILSESVYIPQPLREDFTAIRESLRKLDEDEMERLNRIAYHLRYHMRSRT